MGRKKNPNNNYFDEKVEQAIADYNIAKTQLERDKLFVIIYPAISKIAEVMFNKIKPEYIDGEPLDIQMDCVCYLSERMYRIKEGKGKAFSYFTVCARNYYIFHNQRGYTGTKKTLKLDVLNENWDIADEDSQRATEMEEIHKIVVAFTDYLKENEHNLLNTKHQKGFLELIIEALLNADDYAEGFNERQFINELTDKHPNGTTRPAVRKLLNRLAVHWHAFKNEYIETGKSIKYFEKQRLTKEELEFCIKNYRAADRRFGAIALGKRFKMDSYMLRRHLSEYGICVI
jgi:hypothetical protein